MAYCILVRNPALGGGIKAIVEPDDPHSVVTWMTEEEAEEAAQALYLCQSWPYRVVETP